jgi:hypothetical protein
MVRTAEPAKKSRARFADADDRRQGWIGSEGFQLPPTILRISTAGPRTVFMAPSTEMC